MHWLTENWHRWIILCLAAMTLTGCGSDSTDNQGNAQSGQGGIAMKLHLSDRSRTTAPQHRSAIDCTASGIDNIKIFVYHNDELLQTSSTIPCSAGRGSVDKIPAGENRRVVVTGIEGNNGLVLYCGQQDGVVIRPNQITGPIEISLTRFQPQNLTAQPGNQQATIFFDTVTGASTYNLYWSTSGDNGMVHNISPGYVLDQLSNGQTYYFTVSAENIGGESHPSTQTSMTPQASGPTIIAVQNITAYVMGSGGGTTQTSQMRAQLTIGQSLITTTPSRHHRAGFWHLYQPVDTTLLVTDAGGNGIYTYDEYDWKNIATANPEAIIIWQEQLLADFGTNGIHALNGQTWDLRFDRNPEKMIVWHENLVLDMGAGGIEIYNGADWQTLTPDNPTHLAIWREMLTVVFQDSGIWTLQTPDAVQWDIISTSAPDALIAWQDLLVADFINDGVYQYDGDQWKIISNSNAQSFTIWQDRLTADFGTRGIQTYDGQTWTAIPGQGVADPEQITGWKKNLIADFGPNGLYKFNGQTWNQIWQIDPENTIAW